MSEYRIEVVGSFTYMVTVEANNPAEAAGLAVDTFDNITDVTVKGVGYPWDDIHTEPVMVA